MSAGTSESLILIVSVGLLVFVSAGQRNITAEPGHDVTLPCKAPPDKTIIVVGWTLTRLEEDYVLFYRDNQLDPENQHPSFQQRVDLQDRQMKDGNVSMILKDVTTDDTGTYECRVVQSDTKTAILVTKPISIVHLEVSPAGRTQDGGDEDGGDKNGSAGLAAGLTVSVMFVTVVVFFNL